MTRIGKIARLPAPLRETLNRRLCDGEPGPRLVAWLNGEASAQAALAEHFEGRPITVQNLSEWRQGGYADWVRHRQAVELMGQTLEQAGEFEALCGDYAITDRAAEAVGLALLLELKVAGKMKAGEKKRRATLEVVRELVRLRRSDHDFERKQWAKERHEADMAERYWEQSGELLSDRLQAEELLQKHGKEVRGCFQTVREAHADQYQLPTAVLEFFKAETAFERRHAAAIEQVKRYEYLRRRNLPPDAEWATFTRSGVKTAAGELEMAGAGEAVVADGVAVADKPEAVAGGGATGEGAVSVATASAVAPARAGEAVAAPVVAVPEAAASGVAGAGEIVAFAGAPGSEVNPTKSDQIQPPEKPAEEERIIYGWLLGAKERPRLEG